MSIKKKDREKIDGLIDSYVNAYKLCFNREYTNKYLDRFASMKYESSLYNSDLLHLRLDIFAENDITDTYDGIENKELNEELKTYFVKVFKKKMKEVLPLHFEELDKIKKAEKEAEKQAKGKK